MPRYVYTPQEYADMHFIYGVCEGNGRAAARLYHERYPDRRAPDHRVISGTHQAYSEGRIPGQGVGGAGEGRPRVYEDNITQPTPKATPKKKPASRRNRRKSSSSADENEPPNIDESTPVRKSNRRQQARNNKAVEDTESDEEELKNDNDDDVFKKPSIRKTTRKRK